MEVSVLPNPFVNTVVISVRLLNICKVNANVTDGLGNQIIELYDDFMEEGDHTIFWNGRDNGDALMPPGEYYVSLTSNGIIQSYKIVKY